MSLLLDCLVFMMPTKSLSHSSQVLLYLNIFFIDERGGICVESLMHDGKVSSEAL